MDLIIRPLEGPTDAEAFRRLNEQWIAEHFTLEEADRLQLADPVAYYVAPGGQVLVAELDGRVVGCVAVRPQPGTRRFELSKMAVEPGLRGHGAGRRILAAGIACARDLGAGSLYLGSSTKLPDAVHLYEALGFVHVSREQLNLPFARASVFMELQLPPA